MATKQQVLDALRAFVRQRPGLEFGNYGNVKLYRAEMRQITRDRHHAEALIAAVAWRDSITAEKIIEAAKHAYSGRLEIKIDRKQYTPETCPGRPCGSECDHQGEERVRVDYCTGQYFPTEYRRAVCAVMAACLWDYWRDYCMPVPANAPTSQSPRSILSVYKLPNGRTGSAGDYLRATAQRELGRTIAQRWFN